MLGKTLLPKFGGTPAVWTVCLLFFQALLLASYTYAHFTRRKIHLTLLAASVLALPIGLVDKTGWGPVSSILITLFFSAGLPYFVLGSTSPLLQRWSNLENPYRLYALSNVASLLALVSYPFLIEPWLSVGTQFKIWSILYALFVVLCGIVTWQGKEPESERQIVTTRWGQWTLWILFSAVGSALLAATTNQVCQEVAPVPFLWIAPMVLYLVSFILTFERQTFYHRDWFSLFAAILIPIAAALLAVGGKAPIWVHLLVDFATLFVCLIIVHGELALSRPEPSALTRFYLAIAIGGLTGGVFVALVAPRLFQSFAEFPLCLAFTALIAVIRRYSQESLRNFGNMPVLARASLVGLLAAIIAPLATFDRRPTNNFHLQLRNFYGVLRISDFPLMHPVRTMTHGRTTHGMQFLETGLSAQPTTYYSRLTGVGMTLSSVLEKVDGPAKIGVVGLGVGTLSTYGRPGDQFRFYELNPQVIEAAGKYFTFLKNSKAKVEIVEGDARISLAKEPAGEFDALIIDAFSSDSIPIHLLTAECGLIYRRHLKPNGRLIIHISNRTLNLEPVVRGLAQYLGMNATRLENNGDESIGMYPASWMVLSGVQKFQTEDHPMILWRDDFAALWPLLRM